MSSNVSICEFNVNKYAKVLKFIEKNKETIPPCFSNIKERKDVVSSSGFYAASLERQFVSFVRLFKENGDFFASFFLDKDFLDKSSIVKIVQCFLKKKDIKNKNFKVKVCDNDEILVEALKSLGFVKDGKSSIFFKPMVRVEASYLGLSLGIETKWVVVNPHKNTFFSGFIDFSSYLSKADLGKSFSVFLIRLIELDNVDFILIKDTGVANSNKDALYASFFKKIITVIKKDYHVKKVTCIPESKFNEALNAINPNSTNCPDFLI